MDPLVLPVTMADGRQLTTLTWGTGDDLVVVLEAGTGAGGRSWGAVARRLRDHARVVSYDRAGYGTSTPDPEPRSLDRLARDLCAVVQGQSARTLVLVGHSWGGPVVRRAVELLPAGTVDALVLVDPSDEHAKTYFGRGWAVSDRVQRALLPVLARTGLLKRLLGKSLRGQVAEGDHAAVVAAASTRAAADACAREKGRIPAGLSQLRAGGNEPVIPVTLISGTKDAKPGSMRGQMVAAHRQSVEAHPQWQLVEAVESGHMVPFTQPEVVVRAVLHAAGRVDDMVLG